MSKITLRSRGQALLVTLMLCGAANNAHAVLMVNELAYARPGGVFHYDLSVRNTGAQDVAIVTFNDAPLADTLIGPSLLAPAGFSALYDDVLGTLDLLASIAFAVGSTVGVFSFDSAVAPATGFFDVFAAIDINGGLIEGPR